MICPTCGTAVVGAQDPTPAELRLLDMVLDFHAKHGRFPKYREIRIALRMLSTTAVYVHVHSLAKKGLLTVEHRRGIHAARRAA